MPASPEQVDLYVSAPGTDDARTAAIGELLELFPLDAATHETLARGDRALLRSKIAPADAESMAIHLRSLGLVAELVRAGDQPSARAKLPAELPSAFSLFDVSAGLVSLDGTDEPVAVAAPVMSSPPTPKPAPPKPAPPPRPVPTPIAAPVSRFRPDDLGNSSFEIALDRPPPDPAAPPEHAGAFEVPRCPTHGEPKHGGQCPRCVAEQTAVKGRWFGGTLHDRPTQRLLIGVGAGLFIGWIVTAPMARHAEMRVADLREQSAREHQRPTEEAHATAAALDAQIDDAAQSAFVRTFLIWGVIAAGITAAWMRLS